MTCTWQLPKETPRLLRKHTNTTRRVVLTGIRINLFRGAYINAKDSAGRTAIILATIKGHIEVVKEISGALSCLIRE